MFVDQVSVHVRGGPGGNGVTSFARQAHEPRGGPDGGDGGHGGDVVVRATGDVATLLEYHHRPHRKAERGRHGQGSNRRGADGDDVVLPVPVGTVVADAEGNVLADLDRDGAECVAARGGRGGRGNASFRTARRRTPAFHELGEPPEERWLLLELRLVCDVALVGFPNAGKSSLVAHLSAAKPKIADYPFTTLSPNLGVVTTDARGAGDDVDFVVADIPGLVEGASEGRGLGHAFLRHVERAGVLVHVLDCASYEQRDPREDLRVLVGELGAYQPGLRERPALVWLNKTDADPETAAIVRPDLEAEGWEVHAGSAVTGEGLDGLRRRLGGLVSEARAAAQRGREAEEPGDRPVLRPAAAQSSEGFSVERLDGGFRVWGPRVERWVHMTDLENEEAVRHLQMRLARAGVERALSEAGAGRGDEVEIAGTVFVFEPIGADPAVEETETEDTDADVAEDGQ